MDKFLELTEDAVSAMLSAGDGSVSPMRNQKGISHKEVHFVFKSSSHPKNPLKPQGTGWAMQPDEDRKAAQLPWDSCD